jgi:hypothetical protein
MLPAQRRATLKGNFVPPAGEQESGGFDINAHAVCRAAKGVNLGNAAARG